MQLIDLDKIIIGDRQRKEFTPKELLDLKRSIIHKGLLHPIVLTADHNLVAGERRLRAITEISNEGDTIECDGGTIPLGKIPFIYVKELSEDDLAEAELEENLLRAPLTWQEQAQAKALIHSLRCKQNPAQSQVDTAKEVAEKTGNTVGSERAAIAQATILAKNMDNPRVANAKSAREAYTNLLEEQEANFRATILKRQANLQTNNKVILGDCLEVLKTLENSSVNTIMSDPPYGINADKMKKEDLHLYDDSPENALPICEAIIREGFRITKPQAILFMFCDIAHFNHLYTYACQQGWVPWRAPIIWRKGTDGHAPWGRAGFVRTYETILFAVKGQKELVLPGGPDIMDFKRPARNERRHAAEKPVALLDHLISLSCLAGDTVLDPCCGSGPIIEAAIARKVNVIAIEKDPSYHAEAMCRLDPEKAI